VVAHAMSRSISLRLELAWEHRNDISFSQLGTQLGNSTLKRLVFTRFSWTPEMLTALGIGLSSNTTLEKLELTFGAPVGNIVSTLQPLAQGLRDARSLCSLVFDNYRLDDVQLTELIGALTLKRLVLTRFSWTPEMLTALGIGLSRNTTLLVLNLSFAHLLENTGNDNIVSLQPLAQGLRDARSLSSFYFNNSGLDDAQLAELIGALRDHPSLRILDFSGNKCQSQGILQIANMLQSPYSKLCALRLASQRDPYAHSEYIRFDIALLASALRTNQILTDLNLSCSRLTDTDMTALALALRENNGLRSLSLYDTLRDTHNIGPNGAKELLESMQYNFSIQFLSIPIESGLEMEAFQREITFLANRNRANRRILSQNNIPSALWALLIERINTFAWGELNKPSVCPSLLATKDADTERASILFCLLRGSPVLFGRPSHKRSNYSGEAMDETKLAALKKQRIEEIP
jgi:hypothetical protein